ncbi:MAG: hypothetical protein U1F42_02995 [Candidatus Competibacteraceae bacterium]
MQRKKLNELEAKEIRLAQISREFNRHLQVCGANVDDVRHALPRESGALPELRLHKPFDFKTGKRGEPHKRLCCCRRRVSCPCTIWDRWQQPRI